MKKIFKILSIALATGLLLVFIIIGLYYLSAEKNRQKAQTDYTVQSLLCDTIRYITEQPQIEFRGFKNNDINKLKFYLIKNDKIIADTVINNGFKSTNQDSAAIWKDGAYKTMNIPFSKFLKSDTIIIETKSRLYFKVWGYRYYAYQHYTMFGYAGSYDCRLSEDCTVNNENFGHGLILMSKGIRINLLPK